MMINKGFEQQLSRKEREKLNRRNEIINAAKSVFALRGFNDATLDEIAEKAEFGKGTLYNYFENKDELFEAVISSGYDQMLLIASDVCADESKNIQTAYIEVAESLLSWLLRDTGVFLLLMRDINKPVIKSKLVEYYPRLVSYLEQPLKRAIEQGEVHECGTEETAAIFISSIFSLYKYTLLKQVMCDADSFAQAVPTYTDEEIHKKTEHIISIVRLTFFDGILKKS